MILAAAATTGTSTGTLWLTVIGGGIVAAVITQTGGWLLQLFKHKQELDDKTQSVVLDRAVDVLVAINKFYTDSWDAKKPADDKEAVQKLTEFQIVGSSEMSILAQELLMAAGWAGQQLASATKMGVDEPDLDSGVVAAMLWYFNCRVTFTNESRRLRNQKALANDWEDMPKPEELAKTGHVLGFAGAGEKLPQTDRTRNT